MSEIVNRKKIFFYAFLTVLVYLIFLYEWSKPQNPLFKEDYSTVILDEKGEILRVYLNSDEQWIMKPSNEPIPQQLEKCVLTFEDKRFYSHIGFDFISILRAIRDNVESGEIKSGASTITMQCARLSEPKPRTYKNKLKETLRAVIIEFQYTKEEILKMYLSHAPYGGNIIGYEAASLRYFSKYPTHLTWAEAAVLAVLPNSPGLISPKSNQNLLLEKRNRLLKDLYDKGIISEDTYNLSLIEDIPVKEFRFPFSAPHLTDKLFFKYKGETVKTTISKGLQTYVEDAVKEYSRNLKLSGINNVSVLIADTKTREVKAYIGSADYFDMKNSGMVDGVTAPRSTGSILKPFLYGMSIDRGYISVQSKIQDVPTYYGAFSPHNADNDYRGLVRADNALIHSLNVPAVRLLNMCGITDFYNLLKSAGMQTLFRQPMEYGLTLIIGGAEGTLWDITSMYCGLGNMGDFKGIYVEKKDSLDIFVSQNRLLSEGSSYKVLKILEQLNRPGSEYYWSNYGGKHPLSWKTGTSYGQRDAWAVGVNPEWTVGVWCGNFSGEGNPNLGGAKTAGPLLFRIFNTLPKSRGEFSFDKPVQKLKRVEICAETGYKAGEFCEERTYIEMPVDSHLRVCPFHRRIYTDESGKYEVCSLCWEPGQYREKLIADYPPSVVQYLRDKGISTDVIPSHNPKCRGVRESGNPIKIIYPRHNSHIMIPRDIDGNYEKIRFKAAHSIEGNRLYWYIDDRYYGFTEGTHEMNLVLESGRHKLYLVDSSGYKRFLHFYTERN